MDIIQFFKILNIKNRKILQLSISTMMVMLIWTIFLALHVEASYDLDCEYFVDLEYATSPITSQSYNGVVPLNKCQPSYRRNEMKFISRMYTCNEDEDNIIIYEWLEVPDCTGSFNTSYTSLSVKEFNCNGGECPLVSFQRAIRLTNSSSTCPSDESTTIATAIDYNVLSVCQNTSGTVLGYPYNSWKSTCNQESIRITGFYTTDDCNRDYLIGEGETPDGFCENYDDYCNCIDWINCDGTDTPPDNNDDMISNDPTTDPTNDPTQDPTRTRNPSADPTNAPTADPTGATSNPSADPTMEPTDDPISDQSNPNTVGINECLYSFMSMILLCLYICM